MPDENSTTLRPGRSPRVVKRIAATATALATGVAVGVVATIAAIGDRGVAPVSRATTEVPVAIGLQPPADPGPFPDSVVPTEPTVTIFGERDGESTFDVVEYPQVQPVEPGVMDFEHYHTGIEIEWWLKTWAHEHQDIVDLYVVGESLSGQPIHQLTITDKSTGDPDDKPAAYFEGNRHSGETTSAESALWLAHHLITNADDPDVAEVLRDRTIYVRPVNNPDGHDMYLYTAQTNRSTVRPYDDDGDGLVDEDAGEDLNGDGYIGQLRQYVGEGQGTHVVDDRDPAGNAMRNVGDGNGDYRVYGEGTDDDGDGAYGEDGIGGLDLHRNYPYNWRVMPEDDATGRGFTQGGAGEYPLSEPETRHVHSWLMEHTNISVVNSMDTRVPMHLRGPSTCKSEECMYPSDLALYERFDAVGQSITGYEYAGDVYYDYATRSGGEPNPLFGHGPDFGYFQYGAIWYGDELWNGGNFEDYDDNGRYEDWERSRWCVENGRDDCFLPWTTYEHPDLGTVEIGGVNPKFWAQNGAPDLLEDWAANQAEFNLHLVGEMPQVSMSRPSVRRLSRPQDDGATHEIVVVVSNAGRIPTALEQAKEVKIVRPDTVTVEGATIVGPEPAFHVAGRGSERVTLRVAAGEAEEVTVTVQSVRGGVDTATATLR